MVNHEKGMKLPKSNSGNRAITIPDYMIGMLKYYKNRQAEQRLISVQDWNISNMIFTDKKGDFLSPKAISNWFQYFFKET